MAGTYARRQMLLRKEDDSPGGFVRMECVGERCTVAVNAGGVGGEARAVLLQPAEGGVRPLGPVIKGAASFVIGTAEAEGCTQAAVVFGDKVLLAGGEGADFARIRRWLAKAAQPPKRERAAPPRADTPPPQEPAPEPVIESSAPDPDLEAAMTIAMEPDDVADAEPADETAIEEGWDIQPFYTPGAPEQLQGVRREGGRIVERLYGVAGVYAPEPPPGLNGFVWEGGFWVYVRAAAENG